MKFEKAISILLLPIILIACSDNNLDKDNQVIQPNFPVLSAPLINIHDDKLLIEGAKRPIIKKINSTDTDGNKKIIYQFGNFYHQIELSKHQILIAWANSNENENMKQLSTESQQTARNILTTIFGQDGATLISTESQPSEDKTIAGLKVSHVSCSSGLCSLKIYR